jgi:hypothetical protein
MEIDRMAKELNIIRLEVRFMKENGFKVNIVDKEHLQMISPVLFLVKVSLKILAKSKILGSRLLVISKMEESMERVL